MSQPMSPPPLSLYVHIPWCVRKCPYCDFNSHAAREAVPEAAYLQALLDDLGQDLPKAGGRTLLSVFLGGGTPSLLSPDTVAALLEGVRARLPLAADAEITLEANPGTVDQARFLGFAQAGVNRLSLGVQSFDPRALQAIGRIHGRAEALRAIEAAQAAGFENLNLDLMFGLPGQDTAGALADLRAATDCAPAHLSWYQLTLEPNTAFFRNPPSLPDDDSLWDMQRAGQDWLAARGYLQYEVSAYNRPGRRCRHNLNYWEFGDYLGIGAGAHGKFTDARDGAVYRYHKPRHPRAYLDSYRPGGPPAKLALSRLSGNDLRLEFMLNALRLVEGVPADMFAARTGLEKARVEAALDLAMQRGWLAEYPRRIRPSAQGLRFLNELLELFLP